MPIRLSLLIATAIAAMLFQNCAKTGHVADLGADAQGSRKVVDGPLLATKTFFIAQDPILLSDNETLLRKGLRLDVNTGILINQNDRDSADGLIKAGQRFCLTPAERDELQHLVQQDAVCAGLNPMNAADYCPMALQLPYALYGSESQVLTEVGSASCLKAPDVDFCGGQGERVADLLDQVVQTLDRRVCAGR